MMPRIQESDEERAERAFSETYYECVGHLNRAERRTAKGKQLVAEARVKALEAKVAVLEAELEIVKGWAA